MKNKDLSNKIANNLIEHPYAYIFIIIAITIISFFGLLNLKFDFSPQHLFEANDSESKKLEELDEIFGKEDKTIMILIKADNIFTVPVIQYINTLSNKINKIKEIASVDSITHTVTARSEVIEHEETLIINKILNENQTTISEKIVNEVKDKILKWPVSKGLIYSDDHNYTVIAAEINPEILKIKQIESVVKQIENMLMTNKAPQNTSTSLAGLPYFRVEVIRNLILYQLTSLPVTFLIFYAVLFFLFRRFKVVLFQLTAVFISLLWGLSLMGATGESLNIINNIIVTVIFVIVISDTVHFLIRYDKEQLSGLNSTDALKKSMQLLIMACFLTSFTSAVGFSSLIAARTNILKMFGLYLGAAILIAYPVTIIVTSTLLKLFPQKPKFKSSQNSKEKNFDLKIQKIGKLTLKKPKTILMLGFFIVGICIAFAFKVKVDTYLMNVFTNDNPVKMANKIMEEHFIGIIPVSILIESEEEDLAKQPYVLKKIDQMQKRIQGILDIKVSVSLADYVKELNMIIGEGAKTIPNSMSMTSQLLEFAEMSSETLPLNKVVNFDYAKTRIRTWLPDSGGRTHLKGFIKIKEIANEIFGENDNIKVSLTGSGYLAALNLDYLIKDLFLSLLLASIIIFFVIGILFKSVKIGVISIIPNMMPLLVTIGYMGIRGYDLDVSTVIIFSISLGMAVDSTIHFIARFMEAQNAGNNCDESILSAFRSSGKAIIFTTFLFLCGFSVLFISNFLPVRLFAELTCITLAAALIGDLAILPAMLKIFHKTDKTKIGRLKRRLKRDGG